MIKTDVHPTSIEDLRQRVRAFEDHYGVPSERMADAFTQNGETVETADLHTWSLLVQTLEAVAPTVNP